ncbi:MAG: hypothetical protein ABW092_09215 [Candidatus Thiodiazotropha sp.]
MKTTTVSTVYQVTEKNRATQNSLELYEPDVWKIIGKMVAYIMLRRTVHDPDQLK